MEPWPPEWWLTWQQVPCCRSVLPSFCPRALSPVPVLTRRHPADHGPEGRLHLGAPPREPRVRRGCSVPARPVWTHRAAWASLPPALRGGGRGPTAGPPAPHGSQVKGSRSNLSSNEGKQISNEDKISRKGFLRLCRGGSTLWLAAALQKLKPPAKFL